VVFLKEQTETKNGNEYTNYYFYHGNTYLGKAEDGLSQIQANIREELGETVDPEKIEQLQEEAKEKMEEEVEDDSGYEMSDHDYWKRREDLEGVGQKFVWENTEDEGVTVEIEYDGEYFNVFEKHGGFTEVEVADTLESEAEALRIANRHMEEIADKQRNNLRDSSVKNEVSDVEAEAPEIGDDFYHVRIRDPGEYDSVRVPDWASDVAGSVSKGSKVKMGKLGEDDWEVQSVMIDKSNVDRKKAKDLAERIAVKIDSSDNEMNDSGENSDFDYWKNIDPDDYSYYNTEKEVWKHEDRDSYLVITDRNSVRFDSELADTDQPLEEFDSFDSAVEFAESWMKKRDSPFNWRKLTGFSRLPRFRNDSLGYNLEIRSDTNSNVKIDKGGEKEYIAENETASGRRNIAEAYMLKNSGEGGDLSDSGSGLDSDRFIFEGDEFQDMIANSELVYQDWDEDSVANIDDREPLDPGDPEGQRVNDEILLSEELKNLERLSENHRAVAKKLDEELSIDKGRVKQPESIFKKLHEKYAEEVTDIVGVTVKTDSKAEVLEVADQLKSDYSLYPIGEERADENHYEEDGFYRAYHLIIEVEHEGESYPAEVQIKTEEQAKLHELAHEYYKRNEDMPELLEEKARQLESGEIDSVDVDELRKKLP
jgi:ppGpp synthetase/RelA/SpoT-type nucleotidyltranferase